MIQPRKGDSKLVAHARRELEMAHLFDVKKEDDYDGFIGRGTLAMVKLFDEWAKDQGARMQALHSVFNYLIAGDLLTPPTNDPQEWEPYEQDGEKLQRNLRNIFYITRDDRKTWSNLRTGERGICQDFKTGKPVEGVVLNDGNSEGAAAQDTSEGGRKDDQDAGKSASNEGPGEATPDGEGHSVDSGVAPESAEAPIEKKAAKKKPSSGKA